MKRQIFMYLFLFAALWIIFQYANAKKVYESQEGKIETLREDKQHLEDSISTLAENAEGFYFKLDRNEKAYAYFERFDVPVDNLERRIEDAIISQNSTSGNPLVPYESANGIYTINKVAVLNHKWILADFTDGISWGEVFLSYSIEDEGGMGFETVQTFLYPAER